jgi:hypothetical protein
MSFGPMILATVLNDRLSGTGVAKLAADPEGKLLLQASAPYVHRPVAISALGEDGFDAEAVVLGIVLRRDELSARVCSLLAPRQRDSFVAFRLERTGVAGRGREEIVRELSISFPELRFRIVDFTEGAGHSPWIVARWRRPQAWLFLGASNSGKTSAALTISGGIEVCSVHGDLLVAEIATGNVAVSPTLRDTATVGLRELNLGLAIRGIFAERLETEFLELVVARAGKRDLIFDMWVPIASRLGVADFFAMRGFFVFLPERDAVVAVEGLEQQLAATQEELRQTRALLEREALHLRNRLSRVLRRVLRPSPSAADRQ